MASSLFTAGPDRTNQQPERAAVLISGGLDSAILLSEVLKGAESVYPLYVRCGLNWEEAERAHLIRFLDAIDCPNLQSLRILEMPVGDLYEDHWSISGRDVPAADSPDHAVFLPGRNVLLLAKALLWCHLHQVTRLALGVLDANPFADASARFLDALSTAVNMALCDEMKLSCPLWGLSKAQVLRLGEDLPLDLTFSCISPQGGLHCGRCNKCAERQCAFSQASIPDQTTYFQGKPCTA